jgi:hypothetical protein
MLWARADATREAVGRSTFRAVGGEPAAQLLLIDVINAHGVLIIQTIWAPVDAIRYGRRQTRSETSTDQATLLRRLAELALLIAGHLPQVSTIVEASPPQVATAA